MQAFDQKLLHNNICKYFFKYIKLEKETNEHSKRQRGCSFTSKTKGEPTTSSGLIHGQRTTPAWNSCKLLPKIVQQVATSRVRQFPTDWPCMLHRYRLHLESQNNSRLYNIHLSNIRWSRGRHNHTPTPGLKQTPYWEWWITKCRGWCGTTKCRRGRSKSRCLSSPEGCDQTIIHSISLLSLMFLPSSPIPHKLYPSKTKYHFMTSSTPIFHTNFASNFRVRFKLLAPHSHTQPSDLNSSITSLHCLPTTKFPFIAFLKLSHPQPHHNS